MVCRLKWGFLIALVLMGLVSAGRLSFEQFLSGASCPLLGALPACYVALTGYVFLALSLVMTLMKVQSKKVVILFFYTGMTIAGGLALAASVMEVLIGNICPVAFGWLPMCYVSLFFAIVILWLFLNLTGSRMKL